MTKPKTLIYVWLLFHLSLHVHSQTDNFTYNGFKHAENNITLNGIAEIEPNGILKLTNDTSRLLGHAFHHAPINFKNSTTNKTFSFSTAFAFAIFPEYERLGGHGLAFTISSTNTLQGSLPSQYLGLLNASDNGNFTNYVFAVEFDTVQDFEFGDINDNHIGIDINSMTSNASTSAGYYIEGNSTKQDLNLKCRKKIQSWIDYDSNKNIIEVRLSLSSIKPNFSILSYHVDLSPVFMEDMYVGFSASTGLLASSHYIYGWSFKINGEAETLDLSSLPSNDVKKKNHSGLIVGLSVSAIVLTCFGVVFGLFLVRKIKNMEVIEEWEHHVGPHRFSYNELKKATRGFKDKELLGFGGFGKVYKGTLPGSKSLVAVKRISHDSKQGLQEFASEIASIGRLRHRNLCQLLGWCRRKDDLLLVYDFMENGSLDKYIYDNPKMILNWEQRFKIIKGVASGLLYLHEEWEQTVIHRDIKAGNVLLDCDMNARLGDFGLAKLYEHGSNPSTTRVVGTLGYLAPELTRSGKPTVSSDVFAFGALLLEVVCGRRPIEPKASPEELVLVDWVWDNWKEGVALHVVDKRLNEDYNENEVMAVIKLGLMCSNNLPSSRPKMRQILRCLEGEASLPEVLISPNLSGGGGGVEFEDFVHSYPSSSACEKVSAWSIGDGDGDVDIEGGSASPVYREIGDIR